MFLDLPIYAEHKSQPTHRGGAEIALLQAKPCIYGILAMIRGSGLASARRSWRRKNRGRSLENVREHAIPNGSLLLVVSEALLWGC